MAGNKKITQLTELSTLDAVSWFEVLDLNETDPNLQNKKYRGDKIADPNSHVQNTDQYLDFGGFNQISAASLVNMQTASHDHDTDTYLDKGQANEVTAANAKLAVDRMHDQDTDTYLAKGTADEVTAYNINLVVNTTPMLWWLTGDPTSTAQMLIGADSAGERVVQLNITALNSVIAQELLESVAAGRYIMFSFPNGHWVAEMKTGFALVSNWVQVVGITKSIDADFTGFGKLTII